MFYMCFNSDNESETERVREGGSKMERVREGGREREKARDREERGKEGRRG